MPNALPIVKEPDLIQRQTAHDIPLSHIASKEIQQLIAAMKTTLKGTPDGVGLAAPQVDKSLRLFIISEEADEIDKAHAAETKGKKVHHDDMNDGKPYEIRDWKYHVFINPKVLNTSRKKLYGPEGCLSVPGVFGTIDRREKITVTAYDETGKKFTLGKSRFFARVMQHELDHLKGTLFIDHADNVMKSQ